MQILSSKYLITMNGDMIVDGAVAVEGDEIVDVGREQDIMSRYSGTTIHEDYADHVIMPGLINCHTHLDMCLYKNFPLDPVRSPGHNATFVDWLLACLNYKKEVSVDEQRRAVEWALDECIQSGTTCVADMGNYEGIFSLLAQRNMRAVLFPEVLSINNFMAKDLFESAMAIIEKYMEYDSDLVHVGVGPYSAYTLSRNLLRIMSQYSRSSRIPIMVHAAESFSEMEFFHNSTGDIATHLFPNIGWDDLPPEHRRTPIQHLSHIGFLDAAPLLVGCTQVSPMDLDHVAQTGSKVIITPRSHMHLGQGKAPYKDLAHRHILTALGTDGIPSVENLSLWDEMRAFVAQHGDSVHLTGHEVISMVTSHAAKALDLQDEVGILEKGKKADMILIDVSTIPQEGDLLMNLIKHVDNYHIKSVMIGGKNVKSMN